jgi:uncharacterized protein YecE (DUF72 family)
LELLEGSSKKGMNNIHIGTSGWSYKDWKGKFYPKELKAKDYLSFYAQHYKATEINSSFYRLPVATTVDNWMKNVPEDFLFCPKVSRYLSHMKKLNEPEEPLERFFTIFEPMKNQMGPVLIQLPERVAFNNIREERFFEILIHQYPEYTFAMEIRHDSWYSQESIQLMKKYGISLVIAQSEQFPYKEEVTAKDIYVRFHGPEALYASSYSDKTLKDVAQKISSWEKEGHVIWVFFNNDINGHALDNSKTLMGFLEEK